MAQPGTILGEYRALEPALWEEIERLKDGRPLARVTVLAPSGGLVRHLKRAAARRFPAGLAGVQLANFFQFALDLAGDGVRFVADRVFYERILLRWLEAHGADTGLFAGPDVRTWDVAGALHAAVRDLEDAAVPADGELVVEALRAAARTPGSRITELDVRKLGALLAAYRDYRATLARPGCDRAQVFRPRPAAQTASRRRSSSTASTTRRRSKRTCSWSSPGTPPSCSSCRTGTTLPPGGSATGSARRSPPR
jgi:hypothetical protein